MSKRNYCTGVNLGERANGCCHDHDRAYGKAGTGTRLQADDALRECLIHNGMPRWQAWSVYYAVRMFGGAWWQRDKLTPATIATAMLAQQQAAAPLPAIALQLLDQRRAAPGRPGRDVSE